MMSRLEKIKQHQYDGYTIWDMGEDNLLWLIEQAERVQELKVWQEKAQQLHESLKRQDEVLDRFRQQNQRYREALKFYADNMTYNSRFDKETGAWEITDISKDLGEKAREALGSESDE